MPATCANCGQPIGNLDTPFLWSDNPVCAPCYARLEQAEALRGGPIPYAIPRHKRPFPWLRIIAIGAVCLLFTFTLLFIIRFERARAARAEAVAQQAAAAARAQH